MKIKNIFGLALAAIAAFSLASCSDEVEYTPAEALTNAQVYFPSTDPSSITLDMNATSYGVTLSRVKTDEDLTVNLATTITTEGAENLLTVPSSVTFSKGQSSVEIPLTYDGSAIGYDNPIEGTITISDASYTTPYGTSAYSFKANIPAPWKSIGKGTFIEHCFACLYGVDDLQYQVEVEENEQVPGYYRLVYPYDGKYGYNDTGDWDDSQTYYLEIHAEDPSKVYMSVQKTGVDWGYGAISVGTLAGYYHDRGAEDKAADYYGTLENGMISFPAGSYLMGMADYNSGSLYAGGNGGVFLALPGYTIADYSCEISYAGLFTASAGDVSAVINATLGSDVTSAKAAVVAQTDDDAAVAEAIANGDVEATDIVAGENKIALGDQTGKLKVVAATIVDGAAKEISSTKFEYYAGKDPWTSLGIGQYSEDFVSSLFGMETQTYNVEIQENTDQPGLYRLVNPYGAAFPLNEEGDYDPDATNYLEINATDPDGVYVATQDIALDYGYGEMYVESWGYYYYENGYDLETLKGAGYLGTLADGVIDLPIFSKDGSDGSTTIWQGLISMGSSAYYGCTNGGFQVVLPSAMSAKAKKASAKKTNYTRMLQTSDKATGLMPIDKKMVKKANVVIK